MVAAIDYSHRWLLRLLLRMDTWRFELAGETATSHRLGVWHPVGLLATLIVLIRTIHVMN